MTNETPATPGDHGAVPSHPEKTLPTPREERVSVLRGDRMCVECGYNLAGQPVLREPHYRLLIVRCPECASIAAPSDYPLVGRWPARFTSALAIAWLVILLAALAAVLGPTIGLTIGLTMDSTSAYSRALEGDFYAYVHSRHPTVDPADFWKTPERFDVWYASQDPSALLRAHGGWLGALELDEASFLIIPVLLSFVAGLILSLAIIYRRRWSIALIASSLAAVALTIHGVVWMRLTDNPPGDSEYAAIVQLGMPLLAGVLIAEWCAVLTGVVTGRPIGRAMVKAMLPPRFRTALSVLWATDGLQVPDHDPHATRWTRGSLSDDLSQAAAPSATAGETADA